MNFLRLRSMNQPAMHEKHSVSETRASTISGLIAEGAVTERGSSGSRNSESDDCGDENGSMPNSSGKRISRVGSHTDVTGNDGMIIIPYKAIPDNWIEAPDMLSYRSLDRNFIFPGEQIRILACLRSHKQDTEIITPFKVAAVMNKSGIHSPSKQNGKVGNEIHSALRGMNSNDDHQQNADGEKNIHSEKDVQTGEILLRMEERRKQTGHLLQIFKNSHYFARISESNEPLWSYRNEREVNLNFSETFEKRTKTYFSKTGESRGKKNPISAVIDRGYFDLRASGGVTRGEVQCCSLSNGDIVVLLQVHVGVEIMKDPVLEILQFEKYHEGFPTHDNENLHTSLNHDPSGDLLKWLLPLNNSTSPRPSILSSSASIRSIPKHSPVFGSSGSPLFSFGHFRSYSMSSLPPNAMPPETMPTSAVKPSFDPEDWNQFSFKQFMDSGKRRNEGLLSFRGVPLIPERFSVRCGLEGVFTPGRRWRRKIQLIQPIEIHSYSVDCNTDDLLCVHVKNVTPEYAPDIVVFIDSVNIILDEVSKGGPPSPIPSVCIEAGNDYSLPNLELRREEEHSFVIKPATAFYKCLDGQTDSKPRLSSLSAGSASSWNQSSNTEGRHGGQLSHQYAVLVSCRCNYTESKLFFKQPISWQPRFSRDLMISVAAETPNQTPGSYRSGLPIQVLTIQASNMSSDDLTLTVMAPISTNSSAISLNESPSSPLSSRAASTDMAERVNNDRQGADVQRVSANSMNQGDNKDGPQSVSGNDQILDVNPKNVLDCTHVWLQSSVPLGCVPSQSTATVKLEVLPLTDGIITLDSLQIGVKERGLIFVPEKELKINATASVANTRP